MRQTILTSFERRALQAIAAYEKQNHEGITCAIFETKMGWRSGPDGRNRTVGYIGGGHLGRLRKRGLLQVEGRMPPQKRYVLTPRAREILLP